MTDGLIRIRGNAGGQVGAAYRGSLAGMNGGTILIDGSAGMEVGMRMKRGIIAVRGPVRDFAGLQMKGGTIVLHERRRDPHRRLDDPRHDRVAEAPAALADIPVRLRVRAQRSCGSTPNICNRWASPSRCRRGPITVTPETPRFRARAKSWCGSLLNRERRGISTCPSQRGRETRSLKRRDWILSCKRLFNRIYGYDGCYFPPQPNLLKSPALPSAQQGRTLPCPTRLAS